MYRYDKSQTGRWLLVLLLVLPLLFLFESAVRNDYWWLVILVGVTGFAIFRLISPLRVRVSDNEILIQFGIGLFRKSISLADVGSVEVADHKMYYGWGIHMIGLKTWVFNIAGRQLVKLSMQNGVTYYIGTESPQEFESAIRMGMRS